MLIHYLYLFIILLILAKIAYLDYKYQLINDMDIFIGLLIIFIYKAFSGVFLNAFLGSLLSSSTYLILFLIVKNIYHKENLGAGDVTLMLLLGAIFGLNDLTFLMFWGNIFAFVGSVALLIGKRKKLSDAIPLAPFYVTATYIFLLKDFI